MLVPIQTAIQNPIRRALLPRQSDSDLVVGALNWQTALDGLGRDYSANANHGTVFGKPSTLARAGVHLDGVDDRIDFGDVGNVQQISMWIKPGSTTEQIVTVDTGAHIRLVGGTVTYVNLTSVATYVNGIVSTTLVADEWQYLVCVFIQVDANNFELGWNGFTYGDIDVMDFRAYDAVKAAAWVAAQYRAGVPDDSLVGSWFDSGVDKSRFGLDLAPVNGPTVGHDMEFVAASTQYLRAAVTQWRPSDSVGTIMAWIKLDSTGALQTIFSSADEATTLHYMNIWISAADNLQYRHRETGVSNDIIEGDTTFVASRWYHIAAVSNGSVISLYVDGVAEGLTVAGGANAGRWLDIVTLRDNVIIGAAIDSTAGQYFDGSIRKVEVFSEAKAAEFVARRHAAERKFF